MKKIISWSTILFLVTVIPILAQKANIQKDPGYIDFGDMSGLESDEMVTEVLIEENLLKLVSKFTGEDEPELSKLLAGLKMVKVNAFGITEKNESKIRSKMSILETSLDNKNWDRIVRVKDQGELTNVYVKYDGNQEIIGLLVMAFDSSGEAVFVNIVGNINLETIGKLGSKFGIPTLEEITEDM